MSLTDKFQAEIRDIVDFKSLAEKRKQYLEQKTKKGKPISADTAQRIRDIANDRAAEIAKVLETAINETKYEEKDERSKAFEGTFNDPADFKEEERIQNSWKEKLEHWAVFEAALPKWRMLIEKATSKTDLPLETKFAEVLGTDRKYHLHYKDKIEALQKLYNEKVKEFEGKDGGGPDNEKLKKLVLIHSELKKKKEMAVYTKLSDEVRAIGDLKEAEAIKLKSAILNMLEVLLYIQGFHTLPDDEKADYIDTMKGHINSTDERYRIWTTADVDKLAGSVAKKLFIALSEIHHDLSKYKERANHKQLLARLDSIGDATTSATIALKEAVKNSLQLLSMIQNFGTIREEDRPALVAEMKRLIQLTAVGWQVWNEGDIDKLVKNKPAPVVAKGGPFSAIKTNAVAFEKANPEAYKRSKAAEKSGLAVHLYNRYAELQALMVRARKVTGQSYSDQINVARQLKRQGKLSGNEGAVPIYINRFGEKVSEKEARERPYELDEERSYYQPGILYEPGLSSPGFAALNAMIADQPFRQQENEQVVEALLMREREETDAVVDELLSRDF